MHKLFRIHNYVRKKSTSALDLREKARRLRRQPKPDKLSEMPNTLRKQENPLKSVRQGQFTSLYHRFRRGQSGLRRLICSKRISRTETSTEKSSKILTLKTGKILKTDFISNALKSYYHTLWISTSKSSYTKAKNVLS